MELELSKHFPPLPPRQKTHASKKKRKDPPLSAITYLTIAYEVETQHTYCAYQMLGQSISSRIVNTSSFMIEILL